VWLRSVEGSLPWTQTPLVQGYTRLEVLAATWSFRDQKLWSSTRLCAHEVRGCAVERTPAHHHAFLAPTAKVR
jgi:hypothetical protein